MADVINLRMARKARNRKAKQMQAEASRARHGQPLSATRLNRAEAERSARRLDQLRLDREESASNGCDGRVPTGDE